MFSEVSHDEIEACDFVETHLMEVLARPKSGIKLVLGLGCEAGPRYCQAVMRSTRYRTILRSTYFFYGETVQIE